MPAVSLPRRAVTALAATTAFLGLVAAPIGTGPAGATAAPVARVDLLSASCTGPSQCTAVGWRVVGTGGLTGAVLTLGPGGWSSPKALPLPAGVTDFSLNGVSCTGTGQCQAVGRTDIKPGAGHTAWAAGESKGAWHLESMPLGVHDSPVTFGSVSCFSAGSCVAVGTYAKHGGLAPLSASWNGTGWHTTVMAARANTRFYFLKGISCPSATDCEAVGYDVPNSGPAATLTEHWDGHSWHVQKSANAADGSATYLNGVSCSGSKCIAVGFDANGKLLASYLSGGSWHLSTLHQPSPGEGGQLTGVSCPAPTRCAAVGYYAGPDARNLPISEVLVNGKWSLASLASNPKAKDTYLEGDSCLSTGKCQAVGAWDAGQGDNALEVSLTLK